MAAKQNGAVTKKKERSPNKCREWEKERRNRFNDAIAQLGEVVKQIMKSVSNDTNSLIVETTQFPKIEIIQRAILFIKGYVEEKSELKSQILALKGKLEGESTQKSNKKDASTQMYKKTKCKLKNPKPPKSKKINVLSVSKPANIELPKEEIVKSSSMFVKKHQSQATTSPRQCLPIILPKPVNNIKRSTENTFVVLPGPYMLPPRPLLFPAAQQAIVLIDSTQHPHCKTSIPIVTRTGSEITKTTMVNILPISAYSHPLSLVTNKKTVSKSEVRKKVKPIQSKKKVKPINKNDKLSLSETVEDNEKAAEKENSKSNEVTNVPSETVVNTETQKPAPKTKDKEVNIVKETVMPDSINKNNQPSTQLKNIVVKEKPVLKIENEKTPCHIKTPTKADVIVAPIDKTEETKTVSVKETLRDKDKLPPILDTTLCESNVDGGNARLELAEELLAASPTAAFLMSFPLVSGNRADSPAEENSTTQATVRETPQKRNTCVETPQPDSFYIKTTQQQIDVKSKQIRNETSVKSLGLPLITNNKENNQHKIHTSLSNKPPLTKVAPPVSSAATEYPFVSVSAPPVVSTGCAITDPTFSLDFDCSLIKPSLPNPTSSYVNNSNFFYSKNDPFNTAKSSIYSNSNITSGHDFNSLSLYPCAMEKYTTSKNKPDFSNVEDNLMKISSSRLTYDIDLGWPHKSFDFVNCTTSANTFTKDNILPTVSAAPLTSFNTDFHVSLGSTANKKGTPNKTNPPYADTITNFYSQPTNFWQDELPFYGNNSHPSKTLISKEQPYLTTDHSTNLHPKNINTKSYEPKLNENHSVVKASSHMHQMADKYSKKSPSKMHINWMTSETRPIMPVHQFTAPITEVKDSSKPTYGNLNQHQVKKQENIDSNYFPIQMNNLPTQIASEEFQVWPSSRPLGTTEISIEPPPINLPTLVGDLALGPHDKKKVEHGNRVSITSAEMTNCNSFLSVTQLMNRTNENMPSRYLGSHGEGSTKPVPPKQNTIYYSNENVRKAPSSRLETNFMQPYVFDEKLNNYDSMLQFSNTNAKIKAKTSSDKVSKPHKNNYSAESLIRGGTQKTDPSKFMTVSQKYNNFNPGHDGSVAQVSHFPPILDYTDNSYTSQQLGTSNFYNSTTSTISNTFYSNFIPSSNLMPSNYPSGNYSGEFIDYNQGVDCNYSNQKYEEFKMKNNLPVFSHERAPTTNYRNTRRESATKHKLECSKKDSKKYPNKKPKLNTDIEDWSDPSHLLWHNRTQSKKHGNIVTDELTFPNYTGNQISGQYQSEFFNSHLMPTNVQGVTHHNMDRSIPSFPVTSRANFNLSTIFPEITMKAQ